MTRHAESNHVPSSGRRQAARPARLVVFISGAGRTLINLHEAIEIGDLDATIELVVASGPCPGVERARSAGLRVVIEDAPSDPSRIKNLLGQHRIDWIVLAGYRRLLPIPTGFECRTVNIHPALLPDFGGHGMYGRRVHQAVINAGRVVSGCTVHHCDDQYDHGKVVLQLTCPVLPGDTPDTLADRVYALECRAYPLALQSLITAWQARGASPAGTPPTGSLP